MAVFTKPGGPREVKEAKAFPVGGPPGNPDVRLQGGNRRVLFTSSSSRGGTQGAWGGAQVPRNLSPQNTQKEHDRGIIHRCGPPALLQAHPLRSRIWAAMNTGVGGSCQFGGLPGGCEPPGGPAGAG